MPNLPIRRLDAAVHRGGEEQRLALGGQRAEQLLHFLAEAHVEHAVGLVEDGHLMLLRVEGTAAQMVEQAAGRADDDVGAIAQSAKLAVHRRAAVDRRGAADRAGGAEAVDFLADLHRELAGRAEDQHLGVARLTSIFCSTGKVKAAVFPEPVSERPTMSLPSAPAEWPAPGSARGARSRASRRRREAAGIRPSAEKGGVSMDTGSRGGNRVRKGFEGTPGINRQSANGPKRPGRQQSPDFAKERAILFQIRSNRAPPQSAGTDSLNPYRG